MGVCNDVGNVVQWPIDYYLLVYGVVWGCVRLCGAILRAYSIMGRVDGKTAENGLQAVIATCGFCCRL